MIGDLYYTDSGNPQANDWNHTRTFGLPDPGKMGVEPSENTYQCKLLASRDPCKSCIWASEGTDTRYIRCTT